MKKLVCREVESDCEEKVPLDICPIPCAKNKKESAMATLNISNLTTNDPNRENADKRWYLQNRLDVITQKQVDKLLKEYNLIEEDYPHTPKELRERLESGRYVIPTDEEWKRLRYNYCNVFDAIEWRDPKAEKDQDGYDEAREAFNESMRPVKDAINIQDPKEALATLQEFEKSLN